jgi:hypothetical protein
VPDVDRALGRRAAAEGTTKAAVIRNALADAAARALRARPRAGGVFNRPGDLSSDVGRYLAETGFRALKPTIDEDAFPLLPADAG